MRARGLVLALAGSLFALQFHASFYPLLAQSADALVGQVSSAQEGAMEGVVVSAKRAGAIVTVSVVTGHDGRYHFPAARLEPGAYTLAIRAAGYDLDGKPTADVEAGKAVTADLKLKPTRNLPAQLSDIFAPLRAILPIISMVLTWLKARDRLRACSSDSLTERATWSSCPRKRRAS